MNDLSRENVSLRLEMKRSSVPLVTDLAHDKGGEHV